MKLLSCGESRHIKSCIEHTHNCFEIVITIQGANTTTIAGSEFSVSSQPMETLFKLSDYDNVEVINQDILKVDRAALAKEKNNGRPIKVVANLPYYITTPIIMGLFENHVPVDSITVMVQKEVADRMQTGPGSKDYGALSLAVQYYAEPYIVANVPPNCFMPRPKVGSAVIRLTRHEEMPVETKDEKLMFSIIRASFNQRRKTLANGLKNSELLHFTKEEIEAAITACGWPLTIRGEALNLQEFARLTDELCR